MVPIGSILMTIALPVAVIVRNENGRPLRRPYLWSIGSFLFCCVAMLQQLLTIKRRLLAGDIGGIEDTIGAVILLCGGLLAVTAFLNLMALCLSYEGQRK